MEYSDSERKAQFVQGLRDMANFMEKVQDVPLPDAVSAVVYGGNVHFADGKHYPMDSKEGLAIIADRIGQCEKEYGSYFTLIKKFAPGIAIQWMMIRDQVCEKIVTGTITRPAEPEKIIPARPERVEELFEWKCAPIMAALPKPDSIEMPEEGEYLAQPEELKQLAASVDDDIPF